MTFTDNRAGARAVMNGEAAYIMFVLQDGQWKIVVWDDSEGGPPTNNPND